MIRTAIWNNSFAYQNLTATYTRGDTARGIDGQTISANALRYAAARLLCGAPGEGIHSFVLADHGVVVAGERRTGVHASSVVYGIQFTGLN